MTVPVRAARRGQAMVETLYAFTMLMLVILAAVQFGVIYWAKATLDYAAFMAARSGAMNNGSLSAMNDELIAWMTPLFTFSADMTAVAAGYQTAKAENDFMKIDIINPTASAAAAAGGTIPNGHLRFRSDTYGGSTIQDANLLKIRVAYLVPVQIPLIATALRPLLTGSLTPPDSRLTALYNKAGTSDPVRVPIISYATVRMQSPFTETQTLLN